MNGFGEIKLINSIIYNQFFNFYYNQELSIKFPHYNRGNVVKTVFNPKEPHCLYQVNINFLIFFFFLIFFHNYKSL